jgi:hypothetical protein
MHVLSFGEGRCVCFLLGCPGTASRRARLGCDPRPVATTFVKTCLVIICFTLRLRGSRRLQLLEWRFDGCVSSVLLRGTTFVQKAVRGVLAAPGGM